MTASKLPPAWLRWFGNDAARGIIVDQNHAPIGCHYYEDPATGAWEVTVFVSTTEVVGGPMDGRCLPQQVQLNIGHVIALFDESPHVYWQSDPVSEDDELAHHISFEGTARGRRVWLRILRDAPQGTGPGRLLHAQSGEMETLW